MRNIRSNLMALALMALLSSAAQAATSTKIFTLANSGSGPMTISGAQISGNTAEYTLVGNTCGSAVAAGSSCALSVRFSPSGAGTRPAAYLDYTSNGTNGPSHRISLAGAGSYPLREPNTVAVASCKHVNWRTTGYGWLWTASNGCVDGSQAPGTVRFQTLVTNSTGANMTVRVNVAADNSATLYVDGAQVSTYRYYSDYAGWPYLDVAVSPGTHRFELHVINDGTVANPAAFSAAITNAATGAVLRSTSQTTSWTYY